MAASDTLDHRLLFHFIQIIFYSVYGPVKFQSNLFLCKPRIMMEHSQYRFIILCKFR